LEFVVKEDSSSLAPPPLLLSLLDPPLVCVVHMDQLRMDRLLKLLVEIERERKVRGEMKEEKRN